MSQALSLQHRIPAADVRVAIRLCLTVFLEAGPRAQAAALCDLISTLCDGSPPLRLYRHGDESQWHVLAERRANATLPDIFEPWRPLVGEWGVELADDPGPAAATRLEIRELVPIAGMPRASWMRLWMDRDTSSARLAGLGDWIVNKLPVLWGSGGLIFQPERGPLKLSYRRIAALAKRHWGVGIHDMTNLQFDALHGICGVNWLTLVGARFAQSRGTSLAAIAADAHRLLDDGVFHRMGPAGLAIAAGSKPISADVNLHEDMSAYVRANELLKPLLLQQPSPMAGPFARPEILSAWHNRFSAPQAWLDCDIHAE